jgi:hypothetical protein
MADTAAKIADKPKLSAKDEVRALLDRLPDDVTLEDIQYHLDVVVKVLQADASTELDIAHEEVFKGFEEKWHKNGMVSSEGFTEEDCDRRFGKGRVE